MIQSNHANPNSVPAVHARMVDQARSAAAYRETMARTPSREPARATDVKGHVSGVSHLMDGYHSVYFDVRHGETLLLMLAASQQDDLAKLKAAQAEGACISLFYEARRGSICSGKIIIVH